MGASGAFDRIRRRALRLGSDVEYDPALPGMEDTYDGCNMLLGGDVDDHIRQGYYPYNIPWGSDYDLGPGIIWDDDPDPDERCTTTTTTSTTLTESVTSTRVCDMNSWPQACHNYVSIAKHWHASNYNPAGHSDHLLCPWTNLDLGRTIPARWNRQHSSWTKWIPVLPGDECQRDEWPFIRFIGAPNPHIQFMRL